MHFRLYWQVSQGMGCLTGLIPWFLCFNLFVLLAILAHFYSHFPGDIWVTNRIQRIDAAWFSDALEASERLSNGPLIFIVWFIFFAGFIYARLTGEAFIWLVSLAARPAVALTKILVDRPRPSEELVLVHHAPTDPAFPSGHVAGSVLVYGLIFYFAGVFIPNVWLRVLVQAACVYIIAFDAIERIWAGHHWFSDVYGGFLFSGLYLVQLIWLHRHVFRRSVLYT